MMLNISFIESRQQSSLLLYNLYKINLAWALINQQVLATYSILSKSMLKLLRIWIPKFLISHITVTLNEGQCHPKWYQNVKLRGLYHHTKFERNWSVNLWIQANINSFWQGNHTSRIFSPEYWIDKIKRVWASTHQQVSTVYHIPLTSIDNFCEIIGAEVFAFSHCRDLESRL